MTNIFDINTLKSFLKNKKVIDDLGCINNSVGDAIQVQIAYTDIEMLLHKRILWLSALFIAGMISGCSFWRHGVMIAAGHTPSRALTAQWQQVAPGMEALRFRADGLFGPDWVVAVRIDAARCAVRVVDTRTKDQPWGASVGQVCPAQGVIINGPFYAEDHSPVGLLVINGKPRQRHNPRNDSGAFLLRYGRPLIVKTPNKLPRGVTQALECKPRLVIQGVVQRFKPQTPAKRSAIGINSKGQMILAASEGRLTLEQWAACMKTRLGCVNALNLDGGPSTQLAVRGRQNFTIAGDAPVPIFLQATPLHD